ncbi:unnamed protein product, partial [Didymodactylos carnosus]
MLFRQLQSIYERLQQALKLPEHSRYKAFQIQILYRTIYKVEWLTRK